ncbi:MAG: glycosyltransferase family 2 protein [Acidobacteria bacterium]|nr:glycosyltransferase family 2 protein [Acidobacteriota bacterium]
MSAAAGFEAPLPRSGLSEGEGGVVARPQVAVIIPAYNEEKSIAQVLRDIPAAWADQVLVVDNGSTDRTAEIARSSGASVVRETERGYGAACLAGIGALPRDTEIVVFLDADYSDFPEDMELLLAPILEGRADMTLSTRTRDRATRAALAPQQLWGNRLACWLMRRRFGFQSTDLGPFRAIRREALERLHMSDRNYGWTVEMQIKAGLAGLQVVEVPLRYRVRIGRSKISGTVKGTLLAGGKILYTIARYALLSGRRRG